jgi:hypothetical protein
VGPAEEGIRGRADLELVLVGQRLELDALLDAEDERLFGVSVLAGREDVLGNR